MFHRGRQTVYVLLFKKVMSSIRKKINFFLLVPPFGQEDLQDLQSIFEVPHLRKQVILLDTQCELFYIQKCENKS